MQMSANPVSCYKHRFISIIYYQYMYKEIDNILNVFDTLHQKHMQYFIFIIVIRHYNNLKQRVHTSGKNLK